MKDKEVGELWRGRGNYVSNAKDHIEWLIRKLVEERQAVYKSQHSCADSHLSDALRDFGIDPKDWK